jgi:phospholipase C
VKRFPWPSPPLPTCALVLFLGLAVTLTTSCGGAAASGPPPPPVPAAQLSASPEAITAGQTATLTWTSSNATSVNIAPGIGAVAASGSVSVTPATTTTYTATVTGPGGTAAASVTVTVNSPPAEVSVTISATPGSITPGQSSTLTWGSQNATSVSIAPGIGDVAASGSMTVTPAATTTYTITATGASGTKTANATVTVTTPGSGDFKSRIKHIIFYMQENRSFDNYFGMLGRYREMKGLPNDIDGLNLDLELTDFYGHKVKPFHFPTVCHDITSPGWNESHFFAHRRSNGQLDMDFWMMQSTDSQGSVIDPHYTRTMGYYDWTDLPYYYELATQFATSDRFFSSLMGPTVPNRIFLYTGTSIGRIRPEPHNHPQWDQKTLFRLLNEHGVSWRYYKQDNSVFLVEFTDWNDPDIQRKVWNISDYYDILSRPTADRDLPQVIFIEQAASDELQLNEHPSNVHGIQPGVANTKKLIDALMNSAAWQSSVFILVYDEAGGLHEHVPPYGVPNPDGTSPMFEAGDIGQWDNFTYSGFRVPFIVVSPWVKKNFVSHTPREFGSILKFIQTRFDLPPLTARDAIADDMLEFFDFSAPSWMAPPPLPRQPWYSKLPALNPEGKSKSAFDPEAGVCDRNLEVAPGHPKASELQP